MVLFDAQIDALLTLLDTALLGSSVVASNGGGHSLHVEISNNSNIAAATVAVRDTGVQESYEAAVVNTVRFIMKDNVPMLEKALTIVDSKGDRGGRPIVCYETHAQPNDPFPRRVWRVPGYERDSYLCYRNYCSCKSYFDKAKATKTRVLCKHLVAVILATVLRRVTVILASEVEVGSMVASSIENKIGQNISNE